RPGRAHSRARPERGVWVTDRGPPGPARPRMGRVKGQEKRVEDKKQAGRPRPPSRPAAGVPGEARGGREPGAEGAAPEELDQVVSMLGDMDIEVDSPVEETPLAEEPEKAAEQEWTEEQPEAEEAAERAPGETADPVRMYLQEM